MPTPSKPEQPLVKNMFSPRDRIVSPTGVRQAQQQYKDDADINSIMRKFQKTGAIEHYAQYAQQYGEATPRSLHDAMNIVTRATEMFDALPSKVRTRFQNNPQDFLEFVQDPKNLEEAKELNIGLAPEAAAAAEKLRQEAEVAETDAVNPSDSGQDVQNS